MAQTKVASRPRRVFMLAAAVLFCAVLLLSCNDKERVASLGDPCVKDDQCQAGRCDEQVCKAKNPREQDEPCQHPLECRSEVCVDRIEGKQCGPGIRPPDNSCTFDQQCTSGLCVEGACQVGGDAGVPDGGATSDPCESCRDCGGQACIGGQCGEFGRSSVTALW